MEITITKPSQIIQAWYLRTAIPGTGRKGQENYLKFEASQTYRAKSNLYQKPEKKAGERPNC